MNKRIKSGVSFRFEGGELAQFFVEQFMDGIYLKARVDNRDWYLIRITKRGADFLPYLPEYLGLPLTDEGALKLEEPEEIPF